MMEPPKKIARETLFRWFFFGVFALILWQLGRVFAFFVTGFLWAAILTVMFYPAHARMLRSKHLRPEIAPFLSTLLVMLVFILPVSLFGWLAVKEAGSVYPAVKSWAVEIKELRESPDAALPLPESLQGVWDMVQSTVEPLGLDLQEMVLNSVDEASAAIAAGGSHVARHLVLWLFNLLVLVLSLFVLFKDGALFVRWATDLLPMEAQHKKHLLGEINATFGAVVRGILAVALLQGFLAGLGFWAAGVHFPLLLGGLTILSAFIPVGGTSLVWGPVCAYLIFKGQPHGWGLLAWCVLAVGLLDNVLKAWLIGTQVRVPLLILFLALLGGVHTYGFMGLLIGPLLVTCALVFVRIYREEYHIRLPSEPKVEDGV